ncbi:MULTISPECIES: hypothetical protein [Streptomyces]|uniref:hypothetical protein n=1 Tax=Streptomyces TaxID=1883 RepID=UPI001CC27761|nr:MULTISPECIES: hypothetical protein [Streptomyces]
MEAEVKWSYRAVMLATVLTAAARLGWVRARRRRAAQEADRWLVVTVNRAPTDVGIQGAPPKPLDRFGDELEVRVRPAPGDHGTELAARIRRPVPPKAASWPARLAGRDPRQEVRTALREAKALLETGEVMLPDYPPTATGGTPAGKLVGWISRRSGGEGVL